MLLKEVVEETLINKRLGFGRRLDGLEMNSINDLPSYKYIKRLYNNKPINEIWDYLEDKYQISDLSR